MLAHGASAVIMDRLFKQSDEFECCVCRKCGLIGEHIDDSVEISIHARMYSRNCKLEGPSNLAMIKIPYSMKLLAQELGGMNIALRFRLKNNQIDVTELFVFK